jgi:uncharacterized protein (DUF305 family)
MSERMRRRRAAAGIALWAALVAVSMAACTAAPDDSRASTAFITPAPPGGSRTDGAGAATAVPTDSEATAADVAFVEAMIAHHEQAVELATLASTRAADPELADLASRMLDVQAAEADAMRAWLERRRTRDLPTGEHDHAEAMPGEISRSTLDRAAQLEGAAFDQLFIDAMVPHHRGAIEMAETRLAEAGDPAVSRWARAIATSQALEVDRLLEIASRLASG